MKQSCSIGLVFKAIFLLLSWLMATGFADAQTATVVQSFDGINGGDPEGGLIKDAGGNLYGTTNDGGANGTGIVFELVNSSGSYSQKILYNFQGSGSGDGAYPAAGLAMDSSGNLFGTTQQGGADGEGTIFELVNSAGSYTEKILHSFDISDGLHPNAALALDSAGNIYGTMPNGGTYGYGTVFKLVNSSGTYSMSTLYDFKDAGDGAIPLAGVILDSTGNLYGTTSYGGSGGNVFELRNSAGTYTETVLYNFQGLNAGDGASPAATLIMDSSGNLYGTTEYGGTKDFNEDGYGTVFELVNSAGTYTEKVLHIFTGLGEANPDGEEPTAGLTMDSKGNLFGTTPAGGVGGGGTVFELVNSSGTYSEIVLLQLASSCQTNVGAVASGGVLFDSSGNVYATALGGGTSEDGTVFKVTISGTSSTTTALASSANPATVGYPLQFTATVNSSAGLLEAGTVSFSEGSTVLGTAQAQCGSATISLPDPVILGIGTYTITAQYTPALTTFIGSTSTFSQTVSEQGVVLTNGNNTLKGTETVNGGVDATSFVGNGAGLTNLNASGLNCTSCVGNMQLAVSYAGSSTQGGPASNSLLFNGFSTSAFQPAGSYATTGANLFTGAQSITGNVTVTGNASTTGTTTLGPSGTPIVEHLSKQFNPTFTLGTGACTSQIFTFTGASNGDTVALGVPNQRMDVGDVIYTAWVSATNKVTIKACAFATKPANLGSGLVRVDIWKH